MIIATLILLFTLNFLLEVLSIKLKKDFTILIDLLWLLAGGFIGYKLMELL